MKDKARKFAIEAHANQQYGKHPYAVHLDTVAEIAAKYGDTAITIAYLHDVVEDTFITSAEIEKVFGKFIADCVAILTDEPGDNREERKPKTYAKMAKVKGDTELALIVKSADRLANMRACVADTNIEMLKKYKSEQPVFRESVFREGLCKELWNEIDEIVKVSF